MAIQRIALGSKGLCHKGKYMLGRPGMGAWSPSFKGDTLGLAESMEDAVAYTRIKGIPCWSTLGAERLALVRIPDGVKTVMIAEPKSSNDSASGVQACPARRAAG